MRKAYFYSLVFAFLSNASIAAIAAPAHTEDLAQTSASLQTSAVTPAGKIDLNSADIPTLQRELSGIGEAKARAIITYRESHGPFASVDELLEVKGIGKAILERNKDKLEAN